LLFEGAVTGVGTVTSSHIEEMIKKLAQSGGLEVLSTDTISIGAITTIGEPSSQSSLPKIYHLRILSLVRG